MNIRKSCALLYLLSWGVLYAVYICFFFLLPLSCATGSATAGSSSVRGTKNYTPKVFQRLQDDNKNKICISEGLDVGVEENRQETLSIISKVFRCSKSNPQGAEEKTDSPKHPFGRPFPRTTPSPLLWRALSFGRLISHKIT